MIFTDKDKDNVFKRYGKRFREHGYSQQALGWGEKGKQDIRFQVLASYWDIQNKSILDIGAGFGDLFKFLGKDNISHYTGIELMPEFVEEGSKIFSDNTNFELIQGNFLEIDLSRSYDLAFISGLFNFKLDKGGNYEFITEVLTKCLSYCDEGIAANFITDRVEITDDLIFNSNPEKILSIALGLSKNIAVRNDYFPFEFSVYINKNDKFLVADTIFEKFKRGWH